MAEDDEIDILGDFSLENILSKNDTNIFDSSTTLVSQNTDLLNCDYTIHPQWLLDKPSTNPALWYNNTPSQDLDVPKDFEVEPHISTENSITDESGWTEKEKNLLNRGIEIFGKSNVNLSQFIGSRTPAEVKYYLKNFYSDVQLSYTSMNEDVFECIEETVVSSNYDETVDDEILEDNEIPASMEEVITAVSTAKGTVPGRKRTNSKKSDYYINYEDIPSGQSLLKSNYMKTETKPHKHERSKISVPVHKKKSVKFKFKTKLKVMNHQKSVTKSPAKKATLKPRRQSTRSESENVETSNVQIVTGNGFAIPVCKGEEVIKIRKENETEDSESDIEIDVEDTEEEPTVKSLPESPKQAAESQKVMKESKLDKKKVNNAVDVGGKVLSKNTQQAGDLEPGIAKILMNNEEPECEVVLGVGEITDVEKFVFHEFFEGRPTKTPARYLKIRNHIINMWNSSKPNYVTKTSTRNGLKQCGDVNCIGRIHFYLEQIGAINFGCEQTTYCRPLYDMIVNQTVPREKSTTTSINIPIEKVVLPRPRNKKKYVNDGEGGYTLMHDERGDIINTTVVNEEPITKRNYIKKPNIQLIYCRAFNDEKQQQYTVRLDLSALILMDLHAHMYLTEVMGLIGGKWNSQHRILSICRYEPCKNIAPSTTHCDMCPISQAKAADNLHDENLYILGWYHSHPTFAPEPSQQDLDTQLSVQQWIGIKKPCIGFILSPFSLHGALIASPYRCLIVDKKENFEDQFVPYKLKVELVSNGLVVEDLLRQARKVLQSECNVLKKSRIDFGKVYFQDNTITYLDKYIYSVKMHLAKCLDINKMTCDAITSGLSEVCMKQFEDR